MRRLGLALILICATFVCVTAKADTVIKDNCDPANWENVPDAISQHYIEQAPSPFSVAPFIGNGRELSKIGLNYGHSAGFGHENEGDPLLWDWHVIFWNTLNDFLADPKGETLAQNWVFDVPSNPDYLDQVGFNGLFNIYYAEIDLTPLHIETQPGVMHVITVAMKANGGGTNEAVVAFSNGTVGLPGEEDWFQYAPNIDPGTFHDLGGAEDRAAFFIATKSPATCHGRMCVSAKAHAQLTFKSACIPGVNC